MTATFTSICNIALAVYLGAEKIDDYDTGNSLNARRCRDIFPTVLDECLEEYPWSFAKKRYTLNESSEERDGYEYIYVVPSDCVMVRELYRVDPSSKPSEFEVMINDAGTGQLLCCNEEDAILEYTCRPENALLFPAYFQKLVSINLAAALTMVIKKGDRGKTKSGEFVGQYRLELKKAKKKDHQKKVYNTEPECEFLTARTQ